MTSYRVWFKFEGNGVAWRALRGHTKFTIHRSNNVAEALGELLLNGFANSPRAANGIIIRNVVEVLDLETGEPSP